MQNSFNKEVKKLSDLKKEALEYLKCYSVMKKKIDKSYVENPVHKKEIEKVQSVDELVKYMRKLTIKPDGDIAGMWFSSEDQEKWKKKQLEEIRKNEYSIKKEQIQKMVQKMRKLNKTYLSEIIAWSENSEKDCDFVFVELYKNMKDVENFTNYLIAN